MAVKLALEATVITMLFIFGLLWLISLIKQKPGKRFQLSGYCLSCSDPIPPNEDFCSEGCENDFYNESILDEEDEALSEQEELEREERKEKSGLFKEEK